MPPQLPPSSYVEPSPVIPILGACTRGSRAVFSHYLTSVSFALALDESSVSEKRVPHWNPPLAWDQVLLEKRVNSNRTASGGVAASFAECANFDVISRPHPSVSRGCPSLGIAGLAAHACIGENARELDYHANIRAD